MDKQAIVYPYDEKEWTTDTGNDLAESQRYHAKEKKPTQNGTYCMSLFTWHFGKWKVIVIEQVSDCWGLRDEEGNWPQRGTRELFGVAEMFISLWGW